MLKVLSFLLYLYSLNVQQSISFIEMVHQNKQHSEILKKICFRESRCSRIGRHKIDQKFSAALWKKIVRKKILRPATCPFHRRADRWSTSGPYGLMRAYHWKYIHSPCLPPSVLDIPLIATWVAYTKLKTKCGSFCTYKKSRILWRGKRK